MKREVPTRWLKCFINIRTLLSNRTSCYSRKPHNRVRHHQQGFRTYTERLYAKALQVSTHPGCLNKNGGAEISSIWTGQLSSVKMYPDKRGKLLTSVDDYNETRSPKSSLLPSLKQTLTNKRSVIHRHAHTFNYMWTGQSSPKPTHMNKPVLPISTSLLLQTIWF